MEETKQTPAHFRAQYENNLMNIPGVVGVGIGICRSGKECIKIYTSVPTDQVLSKLPEGLNEVEVEVEYVGDIKAQPE